MKPKKKSKQNGDKNIKTYTTLTTRPHSEFQYIVCIALLVYRITSTPNKILKHKYKKLHNQSRQTVLPKLFKQ